MPPYRQKKKNWHHQEGEEKGMYHNIICLTFFSQIPMKRDSKSGKEMQSEKNNLFNTPRFFAAHL